MTRGVFTSLIGLIVSLILVAAVAVIGGQFAPTTRDRETFLDASQLDFRPGMDFSLCINGRGRLAGLARIRIAYRDFGTWDIHTSVSP